MKEEDLLELRQRRRLQTVRLLEVENLTRQMMQAASRRDEESVDLLLNMRADPIAELMEMEYGIKRFLWRLSEEDAARAREILDGEKAQTAAEAPVCEQVAQYRRTLQTVRELDKRISLSMSQKKSIYRRRGKPDAAR